MSAQKLMQFFFHHPFRKEITLVIVVKLLALFAIWYLFFSHEISTDPQTLFDHFILASNN